MIAMIRKMGILTVTVAMIGYAVQGLAAENIILAKIGDTEITSADLQEKVNEIPGYARAKFETREGKLKLLDRLVQTELLYQAAIKDGYMERDDIKFKIDDAIRRILTSEYYANEINQPQSPDNAKLLEYYEKNREKYRTEDRVKARHILVETEADAQRVRKEITSGAISFEDAVVKYSLDNNTRDTGGQLGKLKRNSFITGVGKSAEFDSILFNMNPGAVSEPIKTKLGWHIAILDEKIPAGYESFDDVKEIIADDMLVTDSDIEKEYRRHSEKYLTRGRAKISHILLESESDAEDVHNQLKSGAKFVDLVQTKSKDAASIKQDGSLGYLYKDGYIRGVGKDPIFESKVFALNPGEYSEPIKSKKGWHIVLVEEKTEATLKPLEEVEASIRNKLIRDKKENNVELRFDDLMEQFNGKIYEDRVTGAH